eukprot:774011-Pyramimonas_sp.AAC.1
MSVYLNSSDKSCSRSISACWAFQCTNVNIAASTLSRTRARRNNSTCSYSAEEWAAGQMGGVTSRSG